MPWTTSSITSASVLRSPPSNPCCSRQLSVPNTHSCRRMPPSPIGFSALWRGPATKPSSETEIWQVTELMRVGPWRPVEIIALFGSGCLISKSGRGRGSNAGVRWGTVWPVLGLPIGVTACLFDLDGVLTQTAKVHAAAWQDVFDEYLRRRAD